MIIPLDRFEEYIDELILSRGLSYFENGKVDEPEEIGPGIYECYVRGSEKYLVELEIKNGNIIEYCCDCPYDQGPVCKHIVAVIFAIQNEILEIDQKPKLKKEIKKEKKKASKTIEEQLNEILNTISHDELKQFIRNKSKDNPDFRNIFLASFAQLHKEESKEFYANYVKSILDNAAGKQGYIPSNKTREVVSAIDELLDIAQKHYNNNNFKTAIFICLAVMEEMDDVMEYTDDYNDDVWGCVECATDLLYEIAEEELPEDIRIFYFEYCLGSFEKHIKSTNDVNTMMLYIAGFLIKDENEAKRIYNLIEKIPISKYDEDSIMGLRLNIIRKLKGEEAADEFMEQNISKSEYREDVIRKAFKREDFEKAILLANEGIENDKKDRPGLVNKWQDWLLSIAIAQKNNERIIEYARIGLLKSYSVNRDYYNLLKNYVHPDNWLEFIETVLNDITLGQGYYGLKANIYVKEEMWDRLFEYVCLNQCIEIIDQYEAYLKKDYSIELVQMYGNQIIKYLNDKMGRNHYITACRYLRKMKKLGGKEKVEMLISTFRKQYPQRKALMEELDNV